MPRPYNPMWGSRWMTIKQLLAIPDFQGISPSTVRYWIRTGKLSPRRIRGTSEAFSPLLIRRKLAVPLAQKTIESGRHKHACAERQKGDRGIC